MYEKSFVEEIAKLAGLGSMVTKAWAGTKKALEGYSGRVTGKHVKKYEAVSTRAGSRAAAATRKTKDMRTTAGKEAVTKAKTKAEGAYASKLEKARAARKKARVATGVGVGVGVGTVGVTAAMSNKK